MTTPASSPTEARQVAGPGPGRRGTAPRRPGVSARLPLVVGLVLLTGCGGATPTHEESVLRACAAELRERLGLAEGERTSQNEMIGRRSDGWLVRGLSRDVPGVGAQNYECRADDAPSGPPTLTHLRLCAAGDSPWGCPDQR